MSSNHSKSPLRKNAWIYPLIAVVIVISIYQGYRMAQDRREAVEAEYQARLDAFGETNEDGPVLNPEFFAIQFQWEGVDEDVEAILRDPESNELARAQALEVLTLLLEDEAAPLLIERIENGSPGEREKGVRLLAKTGGDEAADFFAEHFKGCE